MILPVGWQDLLRPFLSVVSPLASHYFRTAGYEHGDPESVINGEGSRQFGGRFVRAGIRAVYGSADERTATMEATARKERLELRPQIEFKNYPRITYILEVKVRAHLNLALHGQQDARLGAILDACLQPGDVKPSQDVGEFLLEGGVEALLFPSAVEGWQGTNIVVFLARAPRDAVKVVNQDEVWAWFERMAIKRKAIPTRRA